jgi:hypothetical protein
VEKMGLEEEFSSVFNRFATANRYSIIALIYESPLKFAIALTGQHITSLVYILGLHL